MIDHIRFSKTKRRTFRSATAILAMATALTPALAAVRADFGAIALPTSFIGEAATLALAFAAPALCAGGYLLLKRVVKSVGVPTALVAGLATAAGGVALAFGSNPQILMKLAGL